MHEGMRKKPPNQFVLNIFRLFYNSPHWNNINANKNKRRVTQTTFQIFLNNNTNVLKLKITQRKLSATK